VRSPSLDLGCDALKLTAYMNNSDAPQTQLYAFDHLSPITRDDSLPLITFYAYPSPSARRASPSAEFTPRVQSFDKLYAFVRALSSPSSLPTVNPKAAVSGGKTGSKTFLAGPPRLQVALRWGAARNRFRRHIDDEEPQSLVLSGYGAGLDIKKSDYLAIDDRLASSEKAASHLEVEDKDASPKMDPVKKSDISGDLIPLGELKDGPTDPQLLQDSAFARRLTSSPPNSLSRPSPRSPPRSLFSLRTCRLWYLPFPRTWRRRSAPFR
jgi:hypothetical protein